MAKISPPPMSPSSLFELPSAPAWKTSDYLKAYKGWQYTAIGAIAQEVASLDLHLFKRKYSVDGMEAEEINQHEALSILSHVNDFMTPYDLYEATQVYCELVGEMFWMKLRDPNGKPVELWPLRPDWVTILTSKTKLIGGYKYAPSGVDSIVIDPDDVIHFKYFNPENFFRGKGSIQAAASKIDIVDYSEEYNRTFFYNSAMPSTIITTDKKIPKEERDRFLTEWYAKFGGRGKGNRVAFLSGGVDVKELTQKFRDMEFGDQQKYMRDSILGVMKVPKTVIGLTEDVNRANAEATTRAFMERVITPRMIKFVGTLNERFLSEWGDENLFFNFTDPSPEDVETKLKIYDSGLGKGGSVPWLTINEVREMENYPPVEGGDAIYLPFSLQAMGQESQDNAGDQNQDNQEEDDQEEGKGFLGRLRGLFMGKNKAKSAVLVLPVTKKWKKPQKWVLPMPHKTIQEFRQEKEEKDLRSDILTLSKILMRKLQGEKKQGKRTTTKGNLSKEQKEIYWRALIAKTDVYEKEWRGQLVDFFEDQEKEVLANLDSSKSMKLGEMKGREGSFLFNLSKEIKRMKSIFGPMMQSLFKDQGKEVMDFLGTPGEIMTTTESAVSYLMTEGVKFVKDVNETTREDLRKTLAEGLEKGESIEQLKKRVQAVYADASSSRAKTISRTEVLRSTNAATLEAYKQSGVVTKKEWVTELDGDIDICESLDGEVRDLNKDFSVGVDFPPVHPNCRCTTVPVIESD